MSFLLFVTILILSNLFLFLDIDAFSAALDNRLRLFDNNTKTTISIRSVKTVILDIVTVVLERLIVEKIDILYFDL